MALRNRQQPASAVLSTGWAQDVPTAEAHTGKIVTRAQQVPLLASTPADLASYGPPVTKSWVADHPMAHISLLPGDFFWRLGMGWDGESVFSMLEPWEALACATVLLIVGVLLIHSLSYLPGTLTYLVRRGIYYATGTEN